MPLRLENSLTFLNDRVQKVYSTNRGVLIYHPLDSVISTLPTGQTVSIVGTGYETDTYQGISCIKFDSGANNYFSIPFSCNITKERIKFAVSVWAMKDDTATWKSIQLLSVGRAFSASTAKVCLLKRNANATNSGIFAGFSRSASYYGYYATTNTDVNWHHFLLNVEMGGSVTSVCDVDIYLDGTLLTNVSQSLSISNFEVVQFGSYGSASGKVTRLAALRVYGRHMTEMEIAKLAGEFTPTTT